MFRLQGHQLAQVKVSGQEGPHPAGFWVVGCKLAIIDSVEGHRLSTGQKVRSLQVDTDQSPPGWGQGRPWWASACDPHLVLCRVCGKQSQGLLSSATCS